jgi:DNA topoisomerase-3
MPFYRVLGTFELEGKNFQGEWKAVEGSKYFGTPALYRENGFKEKKDALALIDSLLKPEPKQAVIETVGKKKEKKNPPLLFNLAELQNLSSKLFKISPDETLAIVQELYEKKLVTYPRTDARVLSSAVAKEIGKNLGGLQGYDQAAPHLPYISENQTYKGLEKTRYVNDKQITDHYAIIPTGQGLSALKSLAPTQAKMYEVIVRRFLSIFYPPAVYQKVNLVTELAGEKFFSSMKILTEEGYLAVGKPPVEKKKEENSEEDKWDSSLLELLKGLKKGQKLPVKSLEIKTGETTPPKRYNSGSMILAMENAGQLIEDEELRSQIKGSGIGTSATRAEILKKLVANGYLALNKKTQILTPTQVGEMIYEVVDYSIRPLLNPELTASWEKGLTLVSAGEITPEEYMVKLNDFVGRRTVNVKQQQTGEMLQRYGYVSRFYQNRQQKTKKEKE